MTSLWLAVFGKSSNKVDPHGDNKVDPHGDNKVDPHGDSASIKLDDQPLLLRMVPTVVCHFLKKWNKTDDTNAKSCTC